MIQRECLVTNSNKQVNKIHLQASEADLVDSLVSKDFKTNLGKVEEDNVDRKVLETYSRSLKSFLEEHKEEEDNKEVVLEDHSKAAILFYNVKLTLWMQ